MYLVHEEIVLDWNSQFIFYTVLAPAGGKLVFGSKLTEKRNQRINLSQLFTQIKAFVCSLNHIIFQKQFDQMYLSLFHSPTQ